MKDKTLIIFITLFFLFSCFAFTGNSTPKPTPTPKPSPKPKPNGCGSGWNAPIVPDKPFGSDFTDACNKHDTCYSTPGKSKKECDNQFNKNMGKVCKDKKGKKRLKCEVSRVIYHRAVKKKLGKKAYDKAQGKKKK
ncbi:MAG: hypothetical protein KAW12_12425 [Candidatus Aminicenantes bacterium]|nr:hypothetical protein [Candidatus Aminicenantes bacterium]